MAPLQHRLTRASQDEAKKHFSQLEFTALLTHQAQPAANPPKNDPGLVAPLQHRPTRPSQAEAKKKFSQLELLALLTHQSQPTPTPQKTEPGLL